MTRFPAEYCFAGCTSLRTINIPSNITNLGNNGTFEGCTSLQFVTIPNNVTVIPGSCFGGCSSLTSINLPNSVTLIGQYSFAGCTSLASISFPNTVTTIDPYCFLNCANLKSVIYYNPVIITIENSAFNNVPAMSVYFCLTPSAPNPPIPTDSVYNIILYNRNSTFYYLAGGGDSLITSGNQLLNFIESDTTIPTCYILDSIVVDSELISASPKSLIAVNNTVTITININ
jgi:hypothetical protein